MIILLTWPSPVDDDDAWSESLHLDYVPLIRNRLLRDETIDEVSLNRPTKSKLATFAIGFGMWNIDKQCSFEVSGIFNVYLTFNRRTNSESD